MKLIDSNYEIIEPVDYSLNNLYKFVELCGRVCYKSEDRITSDSATKFVDRMIKSGHISVLEHGTVYLKIRLDSNCTQEFKNWYNYIFSTFDYSPYSIVSKLLSVNGYEIMYITTNLRVLYENALIDELKPYFCTQPEDMHERRYTVRFVCDRGVSHEFVRHRVFSFTQESTRYVGNSSIKPITEFNCDCIDDIINAYNQGFSMKDISINGSHTEWEIRKILLEHNIKIRGLNNKGNRIEDYFSVINTPEKAYLLGIIQTDGNVRCTNHNSTLSITQHEDYSWYINDMLLNFSDKVCDIKDRNCRQLIIGSKSIVKDLINLGIVPNKTKYQTDENINTLWDSIPDDYKGDFIRGCIDGDGYVRFFIQNGAKNESCQIGFCSTSELLIDKIIDFIYNKFDYKCGKRVDKSVYKLWITDRKKSVEIGEFLYRNFKYPFGHPKKASSWIKRINKKYDIASYKDPKFKIIYPYWIENCTPEMIFYFISCMDKCEDCYKNLRMIGAQAQQARQVLPNALKTELIMTGFASQWEHFFDLRDDSRAHPDAQKLAKPLHEEFINRKYTK